jgi:hypothetical protein
MESSGMRVSLLAATIVGGILLPAVSLTCGGATSTPAPPATPTPFISIDALDRSCASVADCTPVFEGEANCCGTGCPNAAIRLPALPAYMSRATSAITAACAGVDGGPMKVCRGGPAFPNPFPTDGCPQARVSCQAGVCVDDVASDAGPTD